MTIKVLNERYQLQSVIKQGGFGIIYKGVDTVLGKAIAIKEIGPDFLGKDVYVDLFLRESKIIAKMNHQNIVHIFDLVKNDRNQLYIVMEYIDGLDLRKIIGGCKKRGIHFPEHVALYIIAEICKALDYAHNCSNSEDSLPLNLVHQDISPSNIMVARNGVAKLIDFGIARIRQNALKEKSPATLQGKIYYMSPEQANSDPALDKRSDIFSLGLVLYESLKGKRFFHDETHEKILDTLQNGKLRIKELASLPRPLQMILQKALEKDRDKRYQNANQLYIDLMTYLISTRDISNIDVELKELIDQLSQHDSEGNSQPNMEAHERAGAHSAKGTVAANQGTRIKTEPDEEIEIIRPLQSEDDAFFNEEIEIAVDAGDDRNGEAEAQPTPGEKLPIDLNDDEIQLEFENNSLPLFGQEETVPQEDPENAAPAELMQNPLPTLTAQELEDPAENDDEIKTLIDVERITARRNKRPVLRGMVVALLLTVVLLGLDFTFHWTPVGTTLSNLMFAPGITIESVPAGATVYLDNRPLKGTTPLHLNEIGRGVHELKLTKAGFPPVVKSIRVSDKNGIPVSGKETGQKPQPYLFRFKTTLELDSKPSGAEVYLNNIKYGKTTPCAVIWEVGEPCEIEMRMENFGNLTGYRLDTENQVDEVEDRRMWNMEVVADPYSKIRVTGLFGHYVKIASNPSNAAIYLDDNPNPIGFTGALEHIFLTAKPQKITLKKNGYHPKVLQIDSEEIQNKTLYANLSRSVEIKAYDAMKTDGDDIGAKLTTIIRNNRTYARNESTPGQISLLSLNYVAVFSKEGYQETRVAVSPEDRIVVARMQPVGRSSAEPTPSQRSEATASRSEAQVAVAVLDQSTGKPVNNVKVKIIQLDAPNASERLFNATDEEGTVTGELAPGLYLFIVEKTGYQRQEKTLVVQGSNLNLIEFSLTRS